MASCFIAKWSSEKNGGIELVIVCDSNKLKETSAIIIYFCECVKIKCVRSININNICAIKRKLSFRNKIYYCKKIKSAPEMTG